MKFSIRLLYLYLFSFIGLIIAVIGTVQIVDLGLKVYVFKGADRYAFSIPLPEGEDLNYPDENYVERETTRQRQRQASTALAMLLVGIPLYKYHWKLISHQTES